MGRSAMETYETQRAREQPLLEDTYVEMEEEHKAAPGPLGQTASLLHNFRVTVCIIIVVLVGLFLCFRFVSTSNIHGLGLNNGKYSCSCDPGWMNTNTSSQCSKPTTVDRGMVCQPRYSSPISWVSLFLWSP